MKSRSGILGTSLFSLIGLFEAGFENIQACLYKESKYVNGGKRNSGNTRKNRTSSRTKHQKHMFKIKNIFTKKCNEEKAIEKQNKRIEAGKLTNGRIVNRAPSDYNRGCKIWQNDSVHR